MPPARDPVYQAILKALDELPRDRGQQFEDCMADLLSQYHPGLVPVRGGGDFGYDGAIPDKDSEPYPLVSTIGEDVSGNLKRNLKQAKESFPEVHKAVLATSQALTPTRRSNLHDRAQELGFRLEQIYEREGVAQLLYRNPKWRKELLDVAGDLPALSVYPPSARRHVEIELVGREEDLEWLQKSSGDRILSGQPGSGKSYLLYHLTRKGWGLFAASESAVQILEAWYELQPRVVVLDDAHLRLELLEELIRARRETGADFGLVVTCWPGYEDQVRPVLQQDGPRVQPRRLELLTRDEILKVYRSLLVNEDDSTLRWMVTEADNRPGLAVLIGQLWLAGEWQRVVEGDALREATLAKVGGAVEEKLVPQALAGFAVGGDAGISMETVAECLGRSPAEIQELCGRLAAAGVLRVGRKRLSVWPRSLRVSLLKTVFFRGDALGLPIEPFVDQAPFRGSTAETLVLAASLGAEIDRKFLRSEVSEHGSLEAWRGMLGLAEHSAWVLDDTPFQVSEVAEGLHWPEPENVVRRLLGEAAESTDPTPGLLPSALQVLRKWIENFHQPQRALDRRRILVDQCLAYREDGGELSVAQRAALLAFSPDLQASDLDPGHGRIVTFRRAVLLADTIEDLRKVWQNLQGLFEPFTVEAWRDLRSMLWPWMNPRDHIEGRGLSLDPGLEAAMQGFAELVLRDLWDISGLTRGQRVELRRLLGDLDLSAPKLEDPELSTFDLLFPEEMGVESFLELESSETGRRLQSLAEQWHEGGASEIAEQLAGYEAEADAIQHRWPRLTPQLCAELAARVEHPVDWARELLEEEIPGDLLTPFLERSVEEQAEGWPQLLERALDQPGAREQALRIGLEARELPDSLRQRLLEELGAHPHVAETLMHLGQTSEEISRALLEHDDEVVALATAVGLWDREDAREVPSNFGEPWRQAIVRARGPVMDRQAEQAEDDDLAGWDRRAEAFSYSLRLILHQDPALAEAWLRARLHDDPRWRATSLDFYKAAISPLSAAQRCALLLDLPDRYPWTQLIQALVDRDAQVYQALLDQSELKSLYLKPLGGVLPDGNWIGLADQALLQGFSPEQVASATLSSTNHAFMGYGQEYWSRWAKAFEEQDKAATNPQVRAAAKAGRAIAEKWIEEAEKQERAAALGRD